MAVKIHTSPITLFVNSFRLGPGNEFLKIWIVADWVPHGVDLQTRNGNDFPGRAVSSWRSIFTAYSGLPVRASISASATSNPDLTKIN
jgi:hypothetical protein